MAGARPGPKGQMTTSGQANTSCDQKDGPGQEREENQWWLLSKPGMPGPQRDERDVNSPKSQSPRKTVIEAVRTSSNDSKALMKE